MDRRPEEIDTLLAGVVAARLQLQPGDVIGMQAHGLGSVAVAQGLPAHAADRERVVAAVWPQDRARLAFTPRAGHAGAAGGEGQALELDRLEGIVLAGNSVAAGAAANHGYRMPLRLACTLRAGQWCTPAQNSWENSFVSY